MSSYVLSINPCVANLGSHDPGAVLMRDGEICFGVEEERFTREKHAMNTFPHQAIEACLDSEEIGFSDLETVVIPWRPRSFPKLLPERYRRIWTGEGSILSKAKRTGWQSRGEIKPALLGKRAVKRELGKIDSPVPTVTYRNHHACHAASAFYPSGYEESLVVTMDGRGETDGTVVWRADATGLERLRTYPYTNSLGFFFGALTKFLGFHANNGEGKVMGLAPYGERNEEIERRLVFQSSPDLVIKTGAERLSDFLIWQSVYSELYFTDVNWRDFRRRDFLRAVREYQERQRRFGR